MDKLEVGGRFSALANRPEGTFFEVTESGLVWFFNYVKPTQVEIAAISEGSPFEIRSMVRSGVLWLFVKCGNEQWAEAPYNPHLSKSPDLDPISDNSSGYALTLVMVDASSQTIRHIRLIGLGNRFSRKLYDDISSLNAAPFDIAMYNRAIADAQMVYSTPQMAAMCNNYWKLKH